MTVGWNWMWFIRINERKAPASQKGLHREVEVRVSLAVYRQPFGMQKRREAGVLWSPDLFHHWISVLVCLGLAGF